MQLNHVRTHPYVAARLSTGRLQLHGWVYDIKTGAIKAYDEDSGQFKILTKEGYDSTLAK